MKTGATPLPLRALLVLLLLAGFAPRAHAYSLRSPQVPVFGGALQGYLNGLGETIDVHTDQAYVPYWTSTVSGNSTFTMMIEFAGNAPANEIGLYDANLAVPSLKLLFPGGAAAGWFAIASFQPGGNVTVNLFDNSAVPVGTTLYTGVDRNKFGFYLNGPGGLYFTEDYRNPNSDAQALVFASTGSGAGNWWLCWEDVAILPSADRDFDDSVLFLESVNPVPTLTTSWGQVKARYR